MRLSPKIRERARRRVFLLLVLALSASFLNAMPADAAIDDVQRSSWGLANETPSRTIDRFDSLGWAVEEANGKIFAGGKFYDVTNGQRTERQPYLASFTRDGSWISSFSPNVGGPVMALEPGPDGSLFVGGEMGQWNGRTYGALVKIDPNTGDVWPGFTTRIYGGSSVVRDLSMGSDGWMYAAGSFTTASSAGQATAVTSVVRFNPRSGELDRTWIPQTSSGVWGVSRSYTQNVVYLAGWNSMMNNNQIVGVSSSNANNVVWDGFRMNDVCCRHMYDIQASEAGTVLAVGEQHGAYLYDERDNWRQIRGHVTSYDSRYQASDTRRGGDFQDIELSRDGRTFYASCHCWGSHSTGSGFTPSFTVDLAQGVGTPSGPVSSTVAYDTTTGLRDRSFEPYMAGDSGGWGVLEASDGCIWIAGGINAVGQPGSQRPGRDLVRLCEEGFAGGGGGGNAAPAPTASCTATIGGGTVEVRWNTAAGAADYVIRRSVNGGTVFWRGASSTTSFTDTSRSGDLTYYVESRNGQVKSDRTTCGTVDNRAGGPEQVASCRATISGNSVAVTWPSAAGAADYVIRRSVDGGNVFWRGTSTTTSFTDSYRTGQLAYYVESRAADRTKSDRRTCSVVDNGGGIQPVASCRVNVNGDTATVTWPIAPNADGDTVYAIRRSVDGGDVFWRGTSASLSFQDTLRNGDITYFVEVRQGNQKSSRTTCSPVV